MRIFPISDLHLERRTLPLPQIPNDVDVLIFAGDGHEGEPERTVDAIVQLAQGRPAVLVLGNHDFYGGEGSNPRTMETMLHALQDASQRINSMVNDDRIHVLYDGSVVEIDGVAFVGATLWGDWSIAGRWSPDLDLMRASRAARREATSFRTAPREYGGSIRSASGYWSPDHTIAAHALDRVRIIDGLIEAGSRPTVVVTHAPPLVEAVDAYKCTSVPWWAPGFYASDFLRHIPRELQPHFWISGHVHRGFDMTFGRTRVVINPLDSADFQPDLILELDRSEARSLMCVS